MSNFSSTKPLPHLRLCNSVFSQLHHGKVSFSNCAFYFIKSDPHMRLGPLRHDHCLHGRSSPKHILQNTFIQKFSTTFHCSRQLLLLLHVRVPVTSYLRQSLSKASKSISCDSFTSDGCYGGDVFWRIWKRKFNYTKCYSLSNIDRENR